MSIKSVREVLRRVSTLPAAGVGILVWFCLLGLGRAQVDRAGLSGTVTDSAGKIIPGIHVVASMPDTGLQRETVTSSVGTYELAELPVGGYAVSFSGNGFRTLTFDRVIQTAGRTRTLNATLQVAGSPELVRVSSLSSQLDETTAALGVPTEQRQIAELPLNGRNWSTLTALAPGAVDTGGSNQRSIRFAGRGLDDNNFTFDGVDATNIVNQAQQSFVRLAIPTDAIQEFHIDTMLFTAENGSTPGGQVAVVSKSGSNALHGTVFEFLRNDIFDARWPIQNQKLPLHLNQFGGNLGGPVVRDRSFYYLTYEGLRQALGQTLIGFVPTPAFRAEAAAANPALATILSAYPAAGLFPLPGNPDADQFTGAGR